MTVTDPTGRVHVDTSDYLAQLDQQKAERLANWLQRGLVVLAPKVPK